MKKVLLTVATVISIIGCQQSIEPQEQDEIIDISTLSKETQLFIPLADIAFKYGIDTESRELIYKEIDKQFDGDNNVLFATLLESKNAVNGRKTKTEDMLKTELALESFKQIENEKPLYP